MTPELFECADGTLINKNNVTHCELDKAQRLNDMIEIMELED